MKNIELIELYKICNGVTSEIDTFAGWKRRGYSVKKGEKSAIKIDIWRPKKGKVVSDADTEFDGEEELKYFYLVPASFFTKEQVEKRAG